MEKREFPTITVEIRQGCVEDVRSDAPINVRVQVIDYDDNLEDYDEGVCTDDHGDRYVEHVFWAGKGVEPAADDDPPLRTPGIPRQILTVMERQADTLERIAAAVEKVDAVRGQPGAKAG